MTPPDEAEVRTDRLEVVQLLYTMLSNRKISDIVDAVAAGSILILGRFQLERLAVLEQCAAALRSQGWVPIIFNFEKPGSRTTQETVEMLASLVHYILADITDCRSVLQELRSSVPDSPSPLPHAFNRNVISLVRGSMTHLPFLLKNIVS